VRITELLDEVYCEVKIYLDREDFKKYINICREMGMRFDPKKKRWYKRFR